MSFFCTNQLRFLQWMWIWIRCKTVQLLMRDTMNCSLQSGTERVLLKCIVFGSLQDSRPHQTDKLAALSCGRCAFFFEEWTPACKYSRTCGGEPREGVANGRHIPGRPDFTYFDCEDIPKIINRRIGMTHRKGSSATARTGFAR